MAFTWNNIKSIPQKSRVEGYVTDAYKHQRPNLFQEVRYEEDKDDGTPCILIVFTSIQALFCVGQLELLRRMIEKDEGGGLEKFRIDGT